MKIFIPFLAAAALAVAPVSASAAINPSTFKLAQIRTQNITSKSAAFNNRMNAVNKVDNLMFNGKKHLKAPEAAPEPILSIGPAYTLGSIDGPGGATWFYTLEAIEDLIPINEYYTQHILREYIIHIFDEEGTEIGTIHDKVHYREGESGSPMADVLPIATKHLFNDDDKVEIVFGIAIWKGAGNNQYRSYVYQLDGKKDAEGFNEPYAVLDGLVSDVLNIDNDDTKTYFTFVKEIGDAELSYEDNGKPSYWEKMMSYKIEVNIFGKSKTPGTLDKVLSYEFPIQCYPGDQESTAYMLSTSHDGKPFFIFQHYEESLFKPYYSWDEDVVQRTENNLTVKAYTLVNDKLQEVQKSSIPVVIDPAENVIASFFSIGDLRWTEDIDLSSYDSDGKIKYIVRRANKVVGNDESTVNSYYKYDAAGKKTATIFENAASMLAISNLPGFDPQHMFVTYNNGEYLFTFVNLNTCAVEGNIPYIIPIEDGDPEQLTANIDRVLYGDKYAYVDEMRLPIEDGDDTYVRYAWLDNNGKLLKIDEVNLGTGIQYAQSFIVSEVLKPGFFHSDDEMEYMVLAKHQHEDNTITEDLVIGQPASDRQPTGNTVFRISKHDRFGVLSSIIPVMHPTNPLLTICYSDELRDKYALEAYKLPFDKANAVESIFAPATGTINYDGSTIIAEGTIRVFDLLGNLVAEGSDSVSTSALAAGMYIAKTADATSKFIVK